MALIAGLNDRVAAQDEIAPYVIGVVLLVFVVAVFYRYWRRSK